MAMLLQNIIRNCVTKHCKENHIGDNKNIKIDYFYHFLLRKIILYNFGGGGHIGILKGWG